MALTNIVEFGLQPTYNPAGNGHWQKGQVTGSGQAWIWNVNEPSPVTQWQEWSGAATYTPEQMLATYPHQLASASLLEGGGIDWQDFGNWQRKIEAAGGQWIVVKGQFGSAFDRAGLFSTLPQAELTVDTLVHTGDYSNATVEQPAVETTPEAIFAPMNPAFGGTGEPMQASVGGWAMKWFALAVIGYWMLKGKFRKKKKRRKS